jgi:hypothetical protein
VLIAGLSGAADMALTLRFFFFDLLQKSQNIAHKGSRILHKGRSSVVFSTLLVQKMFFFQPHRLLHLDREELVQFQHLQLLDLLL